MLFGSRGIYFVFVATSFVVYVGIESTKTLSIFFESVNLLNLESFSQIWGWLQSTISFLGSTCLIIFIDWLCLIQ